MSISNQKYSKMMKELSQLIFEPKQENCQIHKYEEYQYICNNNKCKSYLSLFCGSCEHTHSHLLQYKRATTVLKSFLQEKWTKIQENNHNLASIYTACGTNIRYCRDILNQIQEEVERCKEKISSLPIFQHLLSTILDLHQNSRDNQKMGETLAKLDTDYQIFQKFSEKDQKKQNVTTSLIDKQIQGRQTKWMKVGEDIKKFTEKMLAFIEKLRLEFKMSKAQIQKNRQTTQAMSKKLANLWQILQEINTKKSQKIEEQIQDLPSLIIELPTEKSSKSNKELVIEEESSSLINDNLHKFRNLKSIVIKNKNGRIGHKMWQSLTAKFEYLKFLKQLWLNIRVEDLRWLTKLFKERAHAVRSISILHLTITDQPKLDMKQVAEFCNTLELRELHLVLSRDNITKNNFVQFTKILRFRTSLSSLPMDVLEINLTKNKIIDQMDVNQCTNLFNNQYQAVKCKNINL